MKITDFNPTFLGITGGVGIETTDSALLQAIIALITVGVQIFQIIKKKKPNAKN